MAKAKKRRNLFTFLKDFFSDVKKETKKVMWTSKKNLVKYSVATLGFMLIISLISYVKELVG